MTFDCVLFVYDRLNLLQLWIGQDVQVASLQHNIKLTLSSLSYMYRHIQPYCDAADARNLLAIEDRSADPSYTNS